MKKILLMSSWAALMAATVQAQPEMTWRSAQDFEGIGRQWRGHVESANVPSAQGRPASSGIMSALPAPDAPTKAWLAARIPGLDTAALKAVPESLAQTVLERAARTKENYLDVFTDPDIANDRDLYFLSQDALESIERMWISGTLPVTGTTKDGRTFHMQGFVIGQGKVYMLYDLPQFSFEDGRNEFKLTDGGRVGLSVFSRGDVAIHGLSACGCLGPFCGCADLQRMTKTSPGRVRIKTSRGDRNADVSPIRPR